MRVLTSMLLAALLALSASLAAADQEVVLVASAWSEITTLSILDVRKIYLGITVRRGSRPLRGLRNVSDPKLDGIFVQSAMAMSEQAYERRLISGSLRFGRERPPEITTDKELIAEMLISPDTITYMWRANAERYPDLKVLEILWHEY